MRHKWDIISDKCEVCQTERRVSVKQTYSGWVKGKITEYLVDGKWVDKAPECIKQLKIK